MSDFENAPEKPRADKLAEKFVEVLLAEGVVTNERCVELSQNPSLRAIELGRQKKNITILLESDVPDVDSDELAENIVNCMILKGLELDTQTKEN